MVTDSSKTQKVNDTNQSLATGQFSTDGFTNSEAQAPKDAHVSRGGKNAKKGGSDNTEYHSLPMSKETRKFHGSMDSARNLAYALCEGQTGAPSLNDKQKKVIVDAANMMIPLNKNRSHSKKSQHSEKNRNKKRRSKHHYDDSSSSSSDSSSPSSSSRSRIRTLILWV
jgi:hypothetical protein